MWDEKFLHPRIETVYVFTKKNTNVELVEKLNSDNFDQVSATLKTKFYSPRISIVKF